MSKTYYRVRLVLEKCPPNTESVQTIKTYHAFDAIDADRVRQIFFLCVDGILDAIYEEEYENWDIENPPRRSKTAEPTMGMSGRSLKSVIGPLLNKGRKK